MTTSTALCGVLLLGALAGWPEMTAPEPVSQSWSSLSEVLGSGRDLPDGVRRYGWPRSDLEVSVRGIRIEPPLALSSWAAFRPAGSGEDAVAMGDLVLLTSEVNPVVASLQSGGLEILAIHNHLIDETPRLLYVHFHGHGSAASLGRALLAALRQTKTPLGAPPSAASPGEAEQKAFEAIQQILGRKGSLAGEVLQVPVPRAEKIEEGGREVPASMGMSTALNFQIDGSRAVTTGDFVLIAREVNPVVRELQAHGIEVTALHSHMLREEPRLFFLHFFGFARPEEIAGGLKAALSRMANRP